MLSKLMSWFINTTNEDEDENESDYNSEDVRNKIKKIVDDHYSYQYNSENDNKGRDAIELVDSKLDDKLLKKLIMQEEVDRIEHLFNWYPSRFNINALRYDNGTGEFTNLFSDMVVNEMITDKMLYVMLQYLSLERCTEILERYNKLYDEDAIFPTSYGILEEFKRALVLKYFNERSNVVSTVNHISDVKKDNVVSDVNHISDVKKDNGNFKHNVLLVKDDDGNYKYEVVVNDSDKDNYDKEIWNNEKKDFLKEAEKELNYEDKYIISKLGIEDEGKIKQDVVLVKEDNNFGLVLVNDSDKDNNDIEETWNNEKKEFLKEVEADKYVLENKIYQKLGNDDALNNIDDEHIDVNVRSEHIEHINDELKKIIKDTSIERSINEIDIDGMMIELKKAKNRKGNNSMYSEKNDIHDSYLETELIKKSEMDNYNEQNDIKLNILYDVNGNVQNEHIIDDSTQMIIDK